MDIKTSPLVEMAGEARRPTPWWLGWILIVGVAILAAQFLWSVPQGMLGATAAHGTVGGQVFELLVNGTTIGLVALWVILKEKRSFTSLGFRDRGGIVKFGLGIVGGIALFTASVGLLWLSGQYAVRAATASEASGLAALPIVIGLVLVWAVQGSAEEIAMRGYLLPTHARQMNGWSAILITSIGFAVIHMNFEPLVLINVSLVAVLFALIALRNGSLWMVAGLHAGWNFAQGNLYGIPVSGNAYNTSLVFMNPNPAAPTWLSGGTFGVEASAATTLVLTVVTLWAYLSFRATRPRTPAA